MIVERDPKKLKFDPNQPRKKFNEEIIENIANTYDAQEIINEPEIDKNDMIITGEIRVRGAIKKGLSKIKCKVLSGLSKEDRFERQVIENLHHNDLSDIDEENAIVKLIESRKYNSQQELANILGVNLSKINYALKAHEMREKFPDMQSLISTRKLYSISRLNDADQKKLIAQIEVGKAPKNLIDYVSKIRKMPEDVKEKVLSINNILSIDDAVMIAKFPEEDQRQEMMHDFIRWDQYKEESFKYHLDIVQGKIPEKKILEDPMKLRMKRLLDIKFKIFNNFSNEYLDIIDIQEYRQEAYKIMREIYTFLKQELEKINDISIRKIIEVKEV